MSDNLFAGYSEKDLDKTEKYFMEKYKDTLFNEKFMKQKRKISRVLSYLTEKELEHEKKSICDFVFVKVKNYCRLLANDIINLMRESGDFRPHGEQRVCISYNRNLLGISCSREVTKFDCDRMIMMLDSCKDRHKDKTHQEKLDYIKNNELVLFGKKYPNRLLYRLNDLFEIIEADFRIYMFTTVYFEVGFILYKKAIEKFGEFEILIFEKEFVRSPQEILSIAASTYKNSMFIRRESTEVIFFNKYVRFYDDLWFEYEDDFKHQYNVFRDGIKKYLLEKAGAFDKEGVLKIKDDFVRKTLETGIIWHEWGHHLADEDCDMIHINMRGYFNKNGEVVHVITEALADYAPKRKNKMGAFLMFAENSDSNNRRLAQRNLLAYISDNFFVDNEDQDYFALMSFVLVSLAIYFLNPDGSVNSKLIREKQPAIYDYFVNQYGKVMGKIYKLIKGSIFVVNNNKLSFKIMKKLIFHELKKSEYKIRYRNLERNSNFWQPCIKYFNETVKNGSIKMERLLKKEGAALERDILSFVSDGNCEKYGNSLKEYIFARAKEIGIIEETKETIVNKFYKKTHINDWLKKMFTEYA